ncbi:Asp-tRNA(Asn)/Glu-tRNA(Gln) amidotransferase subunit GatC [Candidatus Uhrbacteria bacterium]|nr:Asp-tRNA(Asn)/Glu-tRNA(Gln) amidotransferase subunit GatC [Candidatus Uhrbacteria bacterium]
MAILTQEEVEHIAELVRLKLTPEEKQRFAEQLSSILEYVAKLQDVDTSAVAAAAYILDTRTVSRQDEISGCSDASRAIILQDMPDREGDLLKVPAVFGEAPKDF